MKIVKYITLLAFFIGCTYSVEAQQFPQFTQYMYNTISVNPAYAGSREFMVINLLNRNQWVGVEGAPKTQTLTVHSSVPDTQLGLGLSVINDKIGYENSTYAYADVSYTINLRKDRWLAFGFKAGASKYDLRDELINDPTYGSDPFLDDVFYRWSPNFGAGVYYRSEYFYFGISAPRLINIKNKTDLEYKSIDRASYYVNGGYLWEISHKLAFKPTFLIKYTNGAPVSVDITSNFYINEKVWLGGFYRLGDGFGALVNFRITDIINIGYSFDYITSDLNPYANGSHEVMLGFDLPFPKPKCNCVDLHN